jgi:hypothetical protein
MNAERWQKIERIFHGTTRVDSVCKGLLLKHPVITQ